MHPRTYRIGEVAALAGVSVRSLHHYEDIGLLCPSGRTAAGYRLYTDQDVLRLQQILIGRRLGLSLEDVRRMLDDPEVDQRQLLLKQRQQLLQQARATAAMIRSIDAALAFLNGQRSNERPQHAVATMDMKQIFDGAAAAAFQEERRPDEVQVMDLAEQHRMLIDRWFYPCSSQMHAGFAAMYEADRRFADNIDRYAAGLTVFWSAAIRANAARSTAPM